MSNVNPNKINNDDLINAVRHGDLNEMRRLLAQRPNLEEYVNNPDTNGYTPLMWAARFNDEDTIRFWSKHNPDIVNLLMMHNVDAVRHLVEQDPDLEAKRRVELDLDAIERLRIRNNKSVDDEDSEDAPLTKAVRCKLRMIKLLIAKGADIHAQNGEGETALMIAVTESECDTREVLYRGGNGILRKVIEYGYFDAVVFLLSYYTVEQVEEEKNKAGETALQIADTRHPNSDVARYLHDYIDKGKGK